MDTIDYRFAANVALLTGYHNSPISATGGGGKLRRKRSFDDADPFDPLRDTDGSNTAHCRKRSRSAEKLDDNHAMSDRASDDDEVVKSAAKEVGAPATKNEKKRVHEDDPDDGSERSSDAKKHYSIGSDKLSPKSRRAAADAEDENKETALPTEATKDLSIAQDTDAAPSAEVFAKSGFSSFSSSAQSPFASINSAKSPFASVGSAKSPFASAGSTSSPFAGVGSNSGATSTKAPSAGANAEQPLNTKDSATSGSTPSAFGSSGFSGFSKTGQSPFGTFGSAKPAMASTTDAAAEAAGPNGAPTEAGAAQGEQSSFASATNKTFGSGFSSLGGNFSSGGGLKTFASGKPIGTSGLGTTPFKTFGAADSDDDDDDDHEGNDDDDEEASKRGFLSPGRDEEDPQDERFYEQTVETGEEGERPLLSTRAKLYVKESTQWKERGVGTFKLNLKESEDPKGPWTARYIMRADGTQKMLMNSPVTPDILVEDRMGGKVKSKSVIFMGFMDGQPTLCLLQMRSLELAEELSEVTQAVKTRMIYQKKPADRASPSIKGPA